ncbi:serine hydroxymethyltransferase [Streptomyces globisporus]|uniref:Serine hydroxymethyltransferase n=1 Tax=Streptomyces globisporus TaxID=1908 RepID=A0A423V610_STRGL|nr:serine hydroxymethyltransferase [Streptomyces globisporus]ROV70020.1 serine hydroxymethyltransferase [Streptomyces globisporus]
MTTRPTNATTTAPRHPALMASDPELAALIGAEEQLQADTLRLIPSENYVSAAVLEASGTVLQNKYSEGYPGKRYYEGQQVIDQVETLAIRRARALFGMDHANVQPYSGSPANLAAYLAFLQPGDTVLGMSLPMGGHLTHGWDVSATGRWFRGVRYGVRRDTGRIDLDEVRDLALAERPGLIFCGGTAVPRTIDFAGFAEIARETGAVLVADIAHIAGLIAGGAHPSPAGHADVVSTTTHKTLRGPRGAMLLSTAEHARAIDRAVFPGLQGGPHNQTTAAIAVALGEAATAGFCSYAHQVVANARALGEELAARGFDLVSGGTDNHLLLIDLTDKDVPGKTAAKALDRAGIVVNYNTVPYDPRKPFDPSGIRIGTPALTSRGVPASAMGTVATWITTAVDAARTGDESTIRKVREEVKELMDAYPAPGLPVG